MAEESGTTQIIYIYIYNQIYVYKYCILMRRNRGYTGFIFKENYLSRLLDDNLYGNRSQGKT